VRGERRREPRPHPLSAAVQQRGGIEQQLARAGGAGLFNALY
jgi:hypothetical protein